MDEEKAAGVGRVSLGVAAGMAAGMAAAYAMSGDAALLRHNLRKMHRCAARTLRRAKRWLA